MNTLLTGASGFLGQYLLAELEKYGPVSTLGRQKKAKDHFCVDLATEIPALDQNFDIVVHNAGKAHTVPRSEEDEKVFFNVNEEGTRNLLTGLAGQANLKLIVFVSSVAVYGVEHGIGIDEKKELNGTSAYALSKIRAEELILDWAEQKKINVVILRLPLVVGSNPPGNLGKMIKAIRSGYYLRIGKAEHRRSMVLATDIAELIPSLVDHRGIYNLTDGTHPSFREIEDHICESLGKKKPISVPGPVVVAAARAGDFLGDKFPVNTYRLQKLTSDLTFDDSKARTELGWNPTPVVQGWEL